MAERAPLWIEELREFGFRGEVTAEVPLAPLTTWRIGGPAELLVRPVDRADLELLLHWLCRKGLPLRVMGNGSNLLVRDAGVRGVVLRLRKTLDQIRISGREVEAGAGASFPAVARAAAGRGLAGLEFAAGIPGTLGGALVMNAGWHEFEIGRHVAWVDWLPTDGPIRRLDAEACRFGYRTSRFRAVGGVVIGAGLSLEPGDPASITGKLETFAESRKRNQPTELPSCGSVFLKPSGDFAGRLIDEAGLKGTRVGDIEVSPKHANFFVNLGHGSAADLLRLVEEVERVVRRRFGVQLVREFEVW